MMLDDNITDKYIKNISIDNPNYDITNKYSKNIYISASHNYD